jgi:hypothetical protein
MRKAYIFTHCSNFNHVSCNIMVLMLKFYSLKVCRALSHLLCQICDNGSRHRISVLYPMLNLVWPVDILVSQLLTSCFEVLMLEKL